MTKTHHIEDLIPAYALGSLDAADAELASQHLTGCSTCLADLQAYQALLSQLPLAAPQVDPPIQLKSQLLARIGSANLPIQKASSSSNYAKSRQRVSFLESRLVFASALALILLVLSNLIAWQQVSQLEDEISRLQSSQMLALNNPHNMPFAAGYLIFDTDPIHATLIVEGLTDLGAAQQYQLWLIKGQQRTSGGVFSVSPDGIGILDLTLTQSLENYTALGITIEPAGGSPGPTGDKVLGLDL